MEPSEKQFFRKVAFGERLAQARTRLKLSQEALAEAVGITARSISRWEHNQAIPQQYYRERLCEVLQTTAEALFTENGEKQQGVEKQVPIWHVPYPRNPYFTGREDILYQLHERLHQEHRIALTQPQIMSGLGGIGKTQTALEYLYRFRDDYQTVLWVGAETPEILISDYRILAHLFQLSEKDSSDQILLREAIKRWFHSHANWLLVFDNVEDMDQLHIMLPDAYQGHILITTRSQIVGTLGLHIDLQKMEPAEGALFLLRRARLLHANAALEDAPPSLFAQANTLVELLDGLPLALDQAGAYIEETACSLSDYLERYATRRTVLLSTRGTLSNHHPDSVTTTLSLTVEQVERSSPIAADLLRVCAFLYAEAIPEEFFIRTGEALSMQLQSISDDPFLLDEAIRKLRRFSLLHREAETKTLSIHRLLQAIIRDRMTRDECRQRINRIIEAMLQIFPSYDNSVYGGIQQRLQRYFSHALMCATHIEQCDITSVKAEELLYRVAQYLQLWGENAQSLLLLKQVINLAKKIYETEQMKVAFYLNALAYVYIDASQYKLAEQCFQQALNVCDNTNQSDLLITANSLLGLASIFCKTGKYGQAQSLAQRALQIKESILGSNHYAIAQILNILGICYRNQEKYTESEILLQRSINIYKETLEEEHFLLASCLRNLGSLYDLQRDYIQASTFYQQALQIYKKRMGKGHILIGTTANKLGNSYFAQKLYQKAEMFFREALMIFERLPEPHYFHTAYVLTDLGELYLVQGHSHLAKSCIERALTIFGETIQISRVGYQEIVYCLLLAGNNLTKRDDLTEARTYYQRGWTIGKQKIGPDHPLTMHCRDRLETQSILRNE